MKTLRGLAALTCLLAPAAARADGAAEPTDATGATDVEPAVEPAPPPSTDDRFQALEQRILKLESDNTALRKKVARPPRLVEVPSLSLADGAKLRFTGYADIAAFGTSGDGVAYVRDAGHVVHPELSRYAWVFLGDPWANPINAQGDSADLGLDRTNIARFDPIQSGGVSSFLVNTVNLGALVSLGDKALLETSLNFEPRPGTEGSYGDLLEIDLAYVELKPFAGTDFHLFAGKFESTFGIEYRRRKAPDRFGVTPSIISRYTSGTPTGIKARGSVAGGAVSYNVAVTNGSMSSSKFARFGQEIDDNQFKTFSGRLAVEHHFGELDAELGVSGMIGAQDQQAMDDVLQGQVGADLRLELSDLSLRAEALWVHAGHEDQMEGIYLDARGAYGEIAYQLLPWVGAMTRVDYRRARLFTDPNFYLSEDLRATFALRFDIGWNTIAKLEYTHIDELDGPEIADDVFTSSFIFRF